MIFRLSIALVLTSFSVWGQAVNNNIRDRLPLELEGAPFRSSTAYASVEWNCIDKALTNKCVVYHNDQWFTFTLKEAGNYYLNISSQSCRSLRGVQLIIIEGNPCELSTYKILECIPRIRQEDVYVELAALRPDVQYLVNVDGFLGDFCDFSIQLSSRAQGLPRVTQNLDTLALRVSEGQRVVNLDWTVNADLARELEEFRIFRRRKSDPLAHETGREGIHSNAYGAAAVRYHRSDTLPGEGAYTYQIFGVRRSGGSMLLDEQQIHYYEKSSTPQKEPTTSVFLNLAYPDKTLFEVLVFSRSDYKQLYRFSGAFDSARNRLFPLQFGEWIDQGIKEFIVLVSDGSSKASNEYYYKVNASGSVVRE